MLKRVVNELVKRKGLDRFYYINTLWRYFLTQTYYKVFLQKVGPGTKIFAPLKINGASNIRLGKGVIVEKMTWLAALGTKQSNYEVSLTIDDGAVLGHFNHIYATEKIYIGKNVLTADNVYISDNLHEYHNVDIPVISQPIKQLSHVFIGEGTWIGENVCIIGARIGKNCVIGANAVVTKDIPDYCVAVGTPAKIIRRYCFENNEWIKTDQNGEQYG